MKKDVDGTINNIKGVVDYGVQFATDGKVRDQAMKSMGQAWDNMVEGFKKDPAYSLGGAAFDVASMLVGAGEVKAGLSAAKATQGIVRGINAFGKTVGKAAVKNASAMAKNIAHLATRGPGLAKDIGKAAWAKMKQINQGVSRILDNMPSTFDDAYAYAEGFFSKDFTKHNAREYRPSGGRSDEDWKKLVDETFAKYRTGDTSSVSGKVDFDKSKELSKSEYDSLRKKTPSKKIRDLVNDVEGEKLDPVYGYPVEKFEADHIVPMKEITQMDGFALLSTDDKVEVLNLEENFMGLGKRTNSSKGAKTWSEWQGHSVLGDIPSEVKEKMMDLEKELQGKLQNEISKRLSDE